MPAYKHENGSWYCMFYYRDWTGENTKKKKMGFKTKREALEWEREFLARNTDSLDMKFESFTEIYLDEIKDRIKYNTFIHFIIFWIEYNCISSLLVIYITFI